MIKEVVKLHMVKAKLVEIIMEVILKVKEANLEVKEAKLLVTTTREEVSKATMATNGFKVNAFFTTILTTLMAQPSTKGNLNAYTVH